MSDNFSPIEIKQLLQIILHEYEKEKSIFGIPEELFFNPLKTTSFRTFQFNQQIDTPLGVAAGPHTQMAQNIVAAWLMGARYMELKTIQTLDELVLAKPCIDMQDEGYNCEWSQELKVEESFNEYLNAWIIIHILNHKFGWKQDIGTIFNMSVGYNLEGILKDNVQWFFEKMKDCSYELENKREQVKKIYPAIDSIAISSQISNNVTLSTMHGCPANEIEDIATYLLTDKRLHTFVKLNPTLLGPRELRKILNEKLNFKTVVPEIAFEHDLKYEDALKIIESLTAKAKQENLEFGLKLTNTLESENFKPVFADEVEMMYMSGRALHPLSIHVAKKLQHHFQGTLQLSFSGGAHAFNISEILSCGFKTLTVCTDLLKPGGYMRLNQYFKELNLLNFQSISKENALNNLNHYADKVLDSGFYQRKMIHEPSIKTERPLSYFDCISAPCKDTCATHQDIPDYMYYTANEQFDKAYEVILKTNPFPAITGMVCDHLCQNKCTRLNYDDSLLIREVKRFISEQKETKPLPTQNNGTKVAIIGAGPSGLSCAYYLALAGFSVEVFDAHSRAGGMVQYAIPGFRLTDEAVAKDFKRVTDLGVTIHYETKIDAEKFDQLKEKYHFVYIAVGAQRSTPFQLEGIESKGVLDSLNFLLQAKKGQETGLGKNVVIIGGGNTAMDAARTAYRLVGDAGKVTLVYRRTVNEMPADQGEVKAVLEEGMEIIELTGPEKIIPKNGNVKALLCSKMELKEADESGRPKPVKIDHSEFEIPCDTIIPAIGQSLDIDFVAQELVESKPGDYQTKIDHVFIGGDALRGGATAIKAIGDGRMIAEKIIQRASVDFSIPKPGNRISHSKKELMLKRATRQFAPEIKELALNNRQNFHLVSETLNREKIVNEASRCLYCDEICNICTTVCPNFANLPYETKPVSYYLQQVKQLEDGQVEIENQGMFEINQRYQILNIGNFCNECGNCNTFCPTNSAPYKEKPKFWLTKSSFDKAEEGYYFDQHKKILFNKQKNQIVSLAESQNDYIYTSKEVIATLDKKDLSLLDIQFQNRQETIIEFQQAAEMSVLIEASKNLVFE
ncbi:MAG: putative selenate reductase subunit YgfK [Bacteroidales bacterium]|jgi:putative selenate reductase|nr:putative selenate reductase subunit YgfK [Bacteroidales bacterium]